MIKAIYRRDTAGRYVFVAAFETEQLPSPPSDWPEEIVEYLNAADDLPLVVENIALAKLPAVWNCSGPKPRRVRQRVACDENIRSQPHAEDNA